MISLGAIREMRDRFDACKAELTEPAHWIEAAARDRATDPSRQPP
jgi:hypothetical protein